MSRPGDCADISRYISAQTTKGHFAHVSARISSEAGGISCLSQGRHDTLQLYERIHTQLTYVKA